MGRRGWAAVFVALVVGVLLIVFEIRNERQKPVLSGEFTLAKHAEAVPQQSLQRDFYDRLARSGSRPDSVDCRGDLRASAGSTTHCDAQLKGSWKSGSPQARQFPSGWLGDRADYAVTRVDDRTVGFTITPGISADILENALAQDLGTATFLQCPEAGITGVVGTTVTCKANYGYPDGPCSDPLFDEHSNRAPTLRRCSLVVGVQRITGFLLDLKVLHVTPP